MHHKLFTEFLKYVIASLTALIFDVGLLFVLVSYLHIYYLAAAALSFLVGIAVTYLMSIFWVFDHRSSRDRRIRELGIFLAIGLIGLFFNEAVLWVATGLFGLYYIISKGLSTILVFFWNYIARKRVLF